MVRFLIRLKFIYKSQTYNICDEACTLSAIIPFHFRGKFISYCKNACYSAYMHCILSSEKEKKRNKHWTNLKLIKNRIGERSKGVLKLYSEEVKGNKKRRQPRKSCVSFMFIRNRQGPCPFFFCVTNLFKLRIK